MVVYEDWGGRGLNLVTADCGPSRERAAGGAPGRSGWSHPVGGTEASRALHSTLAPEGRVVLTTLYDYSPPQTPSPLLTCAHSLTLSSLLSLSLLSLSLLSLSLSLCSMK